MNGYILSLYLNPPTTISGIRIQQDQYDNNKFYITDEKNKWHGIITDGSLTKRRYIYVYN